MEQSEKREKEIISTNKCYSLPRMTITRSFKERLLYFGGRMRATASKYGSYSTVMGFQSLLVLIIIWHFVGVTLGYSNLISSPLATGLFFYELIVSLEWVPHTVASLRRVVIAYVIGMTVGSSIAVLLGFTDLIEAILKDFVVAALSIPTALLVVFAAMWFGLSELTPIVAASLVIIPFPAQMGYEAVKDVSGDLVKMAESFNLSRRRVASRIVFPSMLHQLFAAARISFVGGWAVVTLAEVITAENGIGYMIQSQMMNFSISGLLGWTLIITITVVIWEYVILDRLEKRLFDYRTSTGSLASQMGGTD